jgi:phosphatidylserine decarboxylase
MSRLTDWLFIGMQRILPKRLVSHVVYALARIEIAFIKNLFISQFMRFYKISLTDYTIQSVNEFNTFNDFFTRELKPNARPIDPDPHSLVSPVDGRISAQGTLSSLALWQTEIYAKQHFYSVADLLGDPDRAQLYAAGEFTTIYLAPFNYHRVHVPFSGTLTHVRYMPGTLFSVNGTTAEFVADLFVRNERVVCEFETTLGPYALVLVGALNVGCMSIEGLGEIRPKQAGPVAPFKPRFMHRGDCLGAFNMGSTVILIQPHGTVKKRHAPVGGVVTMGTRLMDLNHPLV